MRAEPMINKRLIHIMDKSKKYVSAQVLFQWISLLCNIALMSEIALFLSQLSVGLNPKAWGNFIWILLAALVVRYACTTLASRMSHRAAKQVKEQLRTMIYEKLLHLGLAYQQKARTSEIVQLAVEGVDQLEVYFGSYLPQLFYSILAPLTLFVVLSFVSLPCAVILFLCVPLIPITIVAVLDLPDAQTGNRLFPDDCTVTCKSLRFGYEEGREILNGIHFSASPGSFVALVGESGCGKSTLAAILMGRVRGFQGELTIGGVPVPDIAEDSLMANITYVGHQSYLFRGTVRDVLKMGSTKATDADFWHVLEQVKLADFLRDQQGLDTELVENGINFSGGQRQRLAVARALLHSTPIYIFDEATSNIDIESENAIMEQIKELAQKKTVILISHRLANVAGANQIYVLQQGVISEQGTHKELLSRRGEYARMWNAQQQLEAYGKVAAR